jgi:endonuclease/exonuclease/phosphatase family metal-dependent hydrolase
MSHPVVSPRATRGVLERRRPRLRAIGLGPLWVALGVALAATRGAAAPPGAPATPGPDPGAPPPALTVVTLNVLHGGAFSGLSGHDEHLEERLALTIPALRGLGPDILGIQEASTGRERGDVAARLAAGLGFEHVYGSALFRFTPSAWLNARIAATMNFTEGPAVLSRFPIGRREVLELPRCTGLFDPRVLVFAEVLTPWGALAVFSTHISGPPCQSEAIVRLVEARRGALPGILVGDFNATEDSPTIQRLTRGASFVDAFRVANPEAAGPTVSQPVTVPEPRARRRVDYVFVVPGREFHGRVLASHVVLDHPGRRADGSPLWPSDHYGVLARLALFPGSPSSVAAPHGTGPGDALTEPNHDSPPE